MKDCKYILVRFNIENVAYLERVESFSFYDDLDAAHSAFEMIRSRIVDHRKKAYAIFGPFSLSEEIELNGCKMVTSTVTPDGPSMMPQKSL